MAQAKTGDTVTVHYTGRLSDGTVFDSSRDRDPLEFELGKGEVIPGFEKAVEGMEPGSTHEAEIPADDAYGPVRDDLLMRVPHERFPEDLDPKVGDRLEMKTPDGRAATVQVAEVKDEAVILDANHPLAGRDLKFEIELVKID